jgi:phenylalanyl-tRNA synthetase beta chain
MKISYNWLLDYLDRPVDIQTASAALTEIGLEVDGIEPLGTAAQTLDGLLVGQVLSCEPHPNADKLKCTIVTTDGNNRLAIVCGAPNVAAGQKVVVAPVGTTIHPKGGESFKIKKAKIRGELSEGMLCAEDEIGVGDSHEGIIVLADHIALGSAVAELYGGETDYRIEIGLTPNRSDAISHYGVARDLAAHLRIGRTFPRLTEPEAVLENHQVQVRIEAPGACNRFAGICVSGLKPGPSPEWLQQRLLSIGSKPINNIVDITNFVMFEMGQPLHAYDLRKLAGHQIIVREAVEGEKITLLDKKEYRLQPVNLLICNADEAMGVAGVMGGLNDSIAPDTTEVFLESAHFDPSVIRRSSRLLGIKSDASYRFERGVDPDLIISALQRAVNLLCELAGGSVSSALIDVASTVPVPKRMHLLYANIDKVIGKKIKRNEIRDILIRLDFIIEYDYAEGLQVVAPNYRTDVTREIDIIEEILRIHGLNNIPLGAPVHFEPGYPRRTNKNDWQQRISNQLVSQGFFETMSLSFISNEELACFPGFEGREVRVMNPVNEQVPVLRPSLLFSGLQNIAYNINRRQLDLHLFEFGKIYYKQHRSRTEQDQLGLFITGNQQAESWYAPQLKADFPHLLAHVQNILQRMGVTKILETTEGTHPCMINQLQYNLKGKPAVYLGQVQPSICKYYDIKQDVWFATFDWNMLLRALPEGLQFRELPRFPAVRRDLALVIDQQTAYMELEQLARKQAGHLLQEISLFDVYEGDKLAKGKRSYAMSFIFRNEEKTLTDAEVDAVMQKLITNFEKSLGATVRR